LAKSILKSTTQKSITNTKTTKPTSRKVSTSKSTSTKTVTSKVALKKAAPKKAALKTATTGKTTGSKSSVSQVKNKRVVGSKSKTDKPLSKKTNTKSKRVLVKNDAALTVTKKATVKKTSRSKSLDGAFRNKISKRTLKTNIVKKPKASAKKVIENLPLIALHDAIIAAIQNKKGSNILSIDLRSIEDAVADFFIICEGDATTHLKSIADEVSEDVRINLNEKPWHSEGFENLEWVIIDYVTIVVHIFRKEQRNHYRLEEIWGDGVFKEYK
jgi:ribosome-associated protein